MFYQDAKLSEMYANHKGTQHNKQCISDRNQFPQKLPRVRFSHYIITLKGPQSIINPIIRFHGQN